MQDVSLCMWTGPAQGIAMLQPQEEGKYFQSSGSQFIQKVFDSHEIASVQCLMDGWMDGYCTPIKLESVFSHRPNSTLIGVPLAQVLFLDIFLVRQTQRKPASKHIEVS